MRILTGILFLFSFSLVAQIRVPVDYTKYNTQERLGKYPFNESAKVELISFGVKSGEVNKGAMPTIPVVTGGAIATDKLDQQISLTRAEVDALADILLNTCYRWKVTVMSSPVCYVPRNAIVFYDQNGALLSYIEISFECKGLRRSKDDIYLDEVCDDTYESLEKFFKQHDVTTR